jgi:outer membrane protein OmpA-like peptidoglycan-associated protein
VGIGGVYPRFFSVSGEDSSGNENYGCYASIERYFNGQLSLRGMLSFVHIQSDYYRFAGDNVQSHTVDQFAGNIDAIYKFIPCDLISPYLAFGIGLTSFTNDNSFNPDLNKTFLGYQVNFGLGVEWGLSDNFSIKTEAMYRTASNNKIDGNDRSNENDKGVFGGNGDTYGTFDLGVIWYFDLGQRSKDCEKCPEGIREIIHQDTLVIEKVNTVEKIVRDTVYVEKPSLFGVNFKFDKYNLSPESYPILDHAVETLGKFPDMTILISGYTDSLGTDKYNNKLSENRVNTVYDYLISKGITPNRVKKNWFGEENPVKPNNSDLNRAFNRRVEIKVLSK